MKKKGLLIDNYSNKKKKTTTGIFGVGGSVIDVIREGMEKVIIKPERNRTGGTDGDDKR